MILIIQTPTPNLSSSFEFYKKLNFKPLSEKAPTLLTDGKTLIEINPDRFARSGVKLYSDSWKEIVSELAKVTTVNKISTGFLIGDGTGNLIYLIEGEAPVYAKTFVPEENFGIPGNFAGISLECVDLNFTTKIWNLLGFEQSAGDLSQGWISLVNQNSISVSLMKQGACPHLFFNPSLTYFNGKEGNPKVISKIRNLNIPITEEITAFNENGEVDNIIIRDPGGLGFFIFND